MLGTNLLGCLSFVQIDVLHWVRASGVSWKQIDGCSSKTFDSNKKEVLQLSHFHLRYEDFFFVLHIISDHSKSLSYLHTDATGRC